MNSNEETVVAHKEVKSEGDEEGAILFYIKSMTKLATVQKHTQAKQ